MRDRNSEAESETETETDAEKGTETERGSDRERQRKTQRDRGREIQRNREKAREVPPLIPTTRENQDNTTNNGVEKWHLACLIKPVSKHNDIGLVDICDIVVMQRDFVLHNSTT